MITTAHEVQPLNKMLMMTEEEREAWVSFKKSKRAIRAMCRVCEDCGERDRDVLEIHHETPERIVVLCANCHAKRHRGSEKGDERNQRG